MDGKECLSESIGRIPAREPALWESMVCKPATMVVVAAVLSAACSFALFRIPRAQRRLSTISSLSRMLAQISDPAFFLGAGEVLANRPARFLFDSYKSDVFVRFLESIVEEAMSVGPDVEPREVVARDGQAMEVGFAVVSLRCEGREGCLITLHKERGCFIYNPGYLSARECEIVQLMLDGFTYQEIGDRLFISAGTVRTHVHHVYKKSGASNRADLAQTLCLGAG